MIIKVKAAADTSFIISGIKNNDTFSVEESEEDAKAMAYMLCKNLPGSTIGFLSKYLHDITNVNSKRLFGLMDEWESFAEERKID